jgi:ribosomal protein L37AE/L43A
MNRPIAPELVGATIKRVGVPTLYRGVMMRSRLEARWAAFFDALRWPWEYEPLDLAGYIPDFVLGFEAGDVIVEVKPRDGDLAFAQSKIEVSGWEREAIVVVSAAQPEIGTLLARDGGEFQWQTATLFGCLSCGQPSLRSVEGHWRCRVCGAYAGNAHVGEFEPLDAWNDAGNRVQWRKPE